MGAESIHVEEKNGSSATCRYHTAHEVTLHYGDRTLAPPAVFRVRAALAYAAVPFYEVRERGDDDVLIDIRGRQVSFEVTPAAKLSRVLASEGTVLPDEPGVALAYRVVVGPAEATGEYVAKLTREQIDTLLKAEGRVDLLDAPAPTAATKELP